MFKLLSRFAYRLRWLFVLLGAIVLAVGIYYGPGVFKELKDGGIVDASAESFQEASAEARAFPRSRPSLILFVRSDRYTVDDPKFQTQFDRVLKSIENDPSHPVVDSYETTPDGPFVSHDRHSTYALINLPGDNRTQTYLRIADNLPATTLHTSLGGPVVADYETNREVQRDLPKLGQISVPILAVLLIIIFRSVIAMMLPLLMGAVSVLCTFAITRVIAHHVDMSVFAANIISLLGLGLSIDYSLLFVTRFRDELSTGKSVADAIATSVLTAGESIFLSGATVACSLLGLLEFREMFLHSMGLGGALAVVMAVASSLVVLPAILAILGPWVNRLSVPLPLGTGVNSKSRKGWRAFGDSVVHNAIVITVVTLAVLIAAGAPFLHVRFANENADSLPATFEARHVADAMSREFQTDARPPIQILVKLPSSPTSETELKALSAYTSQIAALPGVKSIHSLVNLTKGLDVDTYAMLYNDPDAPDQIQEALDHLVSGNSTLVSVEYGEDSQSAAAQKLVKEIRSIAPPAGAHVLVGGDTAELVDRLTSLKTHLPGALAIIFVATFVMLLGMLQSLVIPIKAIILNTLSLSASFGVMTWVFQEGHLERLLRFTSSHSLDPTLPVLIFAIAFGLATDYEVFLVSRIKEEHDRTGDNGASVVTGVEKTGGIITSAGLLLIVVVAAFGMSSILPMKEMGVGLAVAVVVDAAIVRTLLVPAAMALVGKVNWWLPGQRL